MGVDHRHANIGVAQEFLDRADVVAVRQHVRGEGVSQCMANGVRVLPCQNFGNRGAPETVFHVFCKHSADLVPMPP